MFGPTQPRSLPQPGHLYDTAIVGAGLAGTELAWRLARAGQDVLLVSQALDHLGNLFHPTLTGISFPQGSLFAQIAALLDPDVEMWQFHRLLKAEMEATTGIHLLQSTVTGFAEQSGVVDLTTWEGPPLKAKKLVLAVGSFLQARLHIGEFTEEAGRLSEVAYDFLSDHMQQAGIQFVQQEQMAEALEGAPAYKVKFLVPEPQELDGFQLGRYQLVWMLGRCLAGEHTYQSVLDDAAAVAQLLESV